jgi:hypothetical protein
VRQIELVGREEELSGVWTSAENRMTPAGKWPRFPYSPLPKMNTVVFFRGPVLMWDKAEAID